MVATIFVAGAKVTTCVRAGRGDFHEAPSLSLAKQTLAISQTEMPSKGLQGRPARNPLACLTDC
jgi:hypothetical protein